MEPLEIGLFILAVAGVVWTTLHAFFEHRSDRLDEFEVLVEQIALNDVYHQYMRPLLMQKLQRWDMEPGVIRSKDTGNHYLSQNTTDSARIYRLPCVTW